MPAEDHQPDLNSDVKKIPLLSTSITSTPERPQFNGNPDESISIYETFDSFASCSFSQPSTFALPSVTSISALHPSAPSPVPSRNTSISSELMPKPPEPDSSGASGGSAAESASRRQKLLLKRGYAIEELLTTERAYLADCELCMRQFLLSPNCTESDSTQHKTHEVIESYVSCQIISDL